MRILHTSDLHIGHRLCNRDRLDEHELFLNWLLDAAEEQNVEYLIIAGDIFDSSTPSNSALRLYYRFLSAFPQHGIKGAVIIGGNHDSPSALGAPKELLESMQIHVRGVKSEIPEDDIVVLSGNGGESVAFALVPYLRERDIRFPKGSETVEERDSGIKEGIKTHFAQIGKLLENTSADGRVFTAHLFTAGSESSEGERDLYVGNLGKIATDILPDCADYTALGHIHRTQNLNNGSNANIRYSGSPLPMDFGETGDKYIYVGDIPGNGMTKLKVPRFRSLSRLIGTPAEITQKIANLSPESPDEKSLGTWMDVQVETNIPDSQFTAFIEEELAGKGIDLLRVHIASKVTGPAVTTTTVSLNDYDPVDMFSLKCEKVEVELDDTLRLAFKELVETVEREGEEVNPGED